MEEKFLKEKIPGFRNYMRNSSNDHVFFRTGKYYVLKENCKWIITNFILPKLKFIHSPMIWNIK